MRRAFAKKPSSDEFFDTVQICAFFCGEKAEVAHLDEASRQNVLEESPDEFLSGHGTDIKLINRIGILISKGHLPIMDIQDVSIGDGHAEDVRGEILQSRFTCANRFYVADPVLIPDGIRDELVQIGLFKCFPEISTDHPGQRLDMDEEIRFGPLPPIAYDTAARNQEVDVRVVSDHPGPCLKDADETDIRSEEPFVPCDDHNSLSRRLEEERIERFLAMSEDRSQPFRYGDSCHEIRNRKQQIELAFEPSFSPVVLASGTMPVAA